MSESGVGTCPQVFVVDSQASYVTMPSVKKPRCAREGQKFLLLLVGLSVMGLLVEGCLIYNLYQKTEAFSLCKFHHLCYNLSNPATFSHKDGTLSSQIGSKSIPALWMQTQQRPFAHLLGSNNPSGENNVVQWQNVGEAITQNMTYDNGRLKVQQEGYYYLYSKVQLHPTEDCKLIQHKVMKHTRAYGLPIELMKSRSNRCWTTSKAKPSEIEDLWSSFLAGIFHLQSGDEIFVTLDKIQEMRPGPTENFMGAFLIFP
ncbi:tumor necrosis factor ligand superfamily member 14-like [Leuresthes tenuis]|uniref:tumor necrosis factor ligand superfamily member 14-like n=1 Tax=Leuresthes tenuis TaxID=355514 RepID=UPI003B50CD37